MNARWYFTLPLLILVAMTHVASARVQRFDGYEIHYSAIPTVMLDSGVARQYGLTRSRQLGLLTVAVLRDGTPVPAAITVLARNLANQTSEVTMREVREGESVYYLGTFRASEQDELTFTLRASPRGRDAAPYELVFEKTFFGEG